MSELTQKLLNDENVISAIDNVLSGAVKKEFNAMLADNDWRFRVFRLIMMKELNDDNLQAFFHAIIKSLDDNRLQKIASILNETMYLEGLTRENASEKECSGKCAHCHCHDEEQKEESEENNEEEPADESVDENEADSHDEDPYETLLTNPAFEDLFRSFFQYLR